jgi:hypothetical protein
MYQQTRRVERRKYGRHCGQGEEMEGRSEDRAGSITRVRKIERNSTEL